MPTYRNDSDQNYLTTAGTLAANGGTIETEEILDHLDGVVRTADTPYYNPVNKRHDVVMTGAGTEEVVLDSAVDCAKLIIRDATLDVEVLINDPANTPAMPLDIDEVMTLAANGKIDKIHITHTASCTLVILEM